MSDRGQAIKDVAEAFDMPVRNIESILRMRGPGPAKFCFDQRERVIALERALRNLEHIVTELYPGDVEPDAEHLGEYQAVWSAVMNARAAMGDH